MRERVELLVGRATRAMWVMTFHSACARMLRADAHRLGYTRQFTIYDSADTRRLIKKCLDDHDIDPSASRRARCRSRSPTRRTSSAPPTTTASSSAPSSSRRSPTSTTAYQRELHRANAMDFDDLLFRAVDLLQLFQEVRDRYASAFRWILVDEYQDTNAAQYRWLQLLSSEHRNLAVVGDDDQCLAAGTLDHDGRRVEAADRARAGGRRGPAPATAAATSGRRAWSGHHRTHRSEGIAITTRSGRRIVSTPEHVHFAGYRLSAQPAAAHDLPPVAAGQGLPRGHDPDLPRPGRRGGRSAAWHSGRCRSARTRRGSSRHTRPRPRHGSRRRSFRSSYQLPTHSLHSA